MTPCPTVAQSLEPSSAVVTKSLSLEDQVGAIPGAPKASLGPENDGSELMRSEPITKADRGFRGVESLRVRAHHFVQVAIACVQVDEEPTIEVIPGAQSGVGGYTVAVVERDRGAGYRACNRMVKIAPCVAASSDCVGHEPVPRKRQLWGNVPLQIQINGRESKACRATHHTTQTAGAVSRGKLQSPLRRKVEGIAPAERDAVVQVRVASIDQCRGNTITEHLTGI